MDLNNGSGPLTLFPGDFLAYRFEPADEFTLKLVASLIFHLLNSEEPEPLTIEVYLWNASDDSWDVFNTRWGDNNILQPSLYVSSDGVVLAALRNWGTDPIEIDNMSFTYTGLTDEGADVYYGLHRDVIRIATEQAATATPALTD